MGLRVNFGGWTQTEKAVKMVIMMNDHDHVHEDDDGNNHDDNKWRQRLSNHNTVLNVVMLTKQTKNTRFQVSLI